MGHFWNCTFEKAKPWITVKYVQCAHCMLHCPLSFLTWLIIMLSLFQHQIISSGTVNGHMSQAHPVLILDSSDNMIGIGVGLWPKQGALLCKGHVDSEGERSLSTGIPKADDVSLELWATYFSGSLKDGRK